MDSTDASHVDAPDVPGVEPLTAQDIADHETSVAATFLAQLHASGALTDGEFAAQKARLRSGWGDPAGTDSEQSIRCRWCYTQNLSSSRNCDHCGAPLDERNEHPSGPPEISSGVSIRHPSLIGCNGVVQLKPARALSYVPASGQFLMVTDKYSSQYERSRLIVRRAVESEDVVAPEDLEDAMRRV